MDAHSLLDTYLHGCIIALTFFTVLTTNFSNWFLYKNNVQLGPGVLLRLLRGCLAKRTSIDYMLECLILHGVKSGVIFHVDRQLSNRHQVQIYNACLLRLVTETMAACFLAHSTRTSVTAVCTTTTEMLLSSDNEPCSSSHL